MMFSVFSQEKCHQYWPAERSARYQYFVVDPMAEYNMPQYILREFKVTDARVSPEMQQKCIGYWMITMFIYLLQGFYKVVVLRNGTTMLFWTFLGNTMDYLKVSPRYFQDYHAIITLHKCIIHSLTWDVSINTVLPWYHVWNHLNTVVLWYCGIKHYHFTYPSTPRHLKNTMFSWHH